ncbi:MAG: WecB/TagA/CpsF family glycosyltransferase [Candidatus Saccharibacteria bacterium]
MNILNVKIDTKTKSQFEKLVVDGLKKTSKTKISKTNTDFLQRAMRDAGFAKVLNDSDINIVDGRGVMWAARYLTLPISSNRLLRPIQAVVQMVYSGASIVLNRKFITYPIAEAIPGIDAFNIMMKSASDVGAGVFIFGGDEATLKSAVTNIKTEFPALRVSGSLNGYDFQTDKNLNPVDEINKTDARLLIVALGSPRQEIWIGENMDNLKNIRVAVGEGGTLDRIANPSQKSPAFINKIGLEWLWRTLFNHSKKNRFRRLWNAVPVFICQMIKWKIRYGQAKI